MPSDIRLIAHAIAMIRQRAPANEVQRYLQDTFGGIGHQISEQGSKHEYFFDTRAFHVTLYFNVISRTGASSRPSVVLMSRKNPKIYYFGDGAQVHTRSTRFLPQWAAHLDNAFGRRLYRSTKLSPKKKQAGRAILPALKRRMMYSNGKAIGKSRAHATSNGKIIVGSVPVGNRFSRNYLNWVKNPTPVPNITSWASPNLPFYTNNVPYEEWSGMSKNAKCAAMNFMPQKCEDGGICWFISILNAILFSENLRAHVVKTLPQTFRNAPRHVQFALHRVAQILAWAVGTGARLPLARTVLQDLHAALPKWFDDNIGDAWEGGLQEAYVKPFLDLLHISNLHLDRDEDNKLRYSVFNQRVGQNLFKWPSKPNTIPVVNASRPPAVLVIHEASTHKNFHQTFNPNFFARGASTLAQGIKVTGAHAFIGKTRYTAQSALLASEMHAVAGVTCGGERYMLNGQVDKWGLPCPPFRFDWVRHKSFYFVGSACNATNSPPTNRLNGTVTNAIVARIYLRDDLLAT